MKDTHLGFLSSKKQSHTDDKSTIMFSNLSNMFALTDVHIQPNPRPAQVKKMTNAS